jgi:uncharacterized membrane-anchored protein
VTHFLIWQVNIISDTLSDMTSKYVYLSYQKVCHWLCLLVISESVSLIMFSCHIRKCVTDCVYLSYQKVCHWLCLLVISESSCHIRKCVTDCVYLSYQKVCHWFCLLVITESVSLIMFTCHVSDTLSVMTSKKSETHFLIWQENIISDTLSVMTSKHNLWHTFCYDK